MDANCTALSNNNSQSNPPMQTNNNSKQIKPYKFKATVEIIGKPNHPYNHVIWIDSVTRTV